MDEGLLSISPAFCGQLVKMLITMESYGIFGSNFAYVLIYMLFSNWYAKSDKGLLSIILASQRLLLKILIHSNSRTAWYILIFCILIHFNSIEPQVCKTVNRLCQENVGLNNFS